VNGVWISASWLCPILAGKREKELIQVLCKEYPSAASKLLLVQSIGGL